MSEYLRKAAGAPPAVAASADRATSSYWAYLASLDDAESRRAVKGLLDRIAHLKPARPVWPRPGGTGPSRAGYHRETVPLA
ncbi:hypothetical protein ACWEJ6_51145, partial [Nonomuraea sp. NPDC004702]